MNITLKSYPTADDPIVAILAVLSGVTVAAAIALVAPMFWSAWMFYWAPQACVLALLLLIFEPPSPAIFTGVALALALHVLVFSLVVAFVPGAGSTTWVYYYFAVPGSAAGAITAVIWLGGIPERPANVVVARAVAVVVTGAVAGQILVWCIVRSLQA
jgi:hypothetical protein